MAEQVGMAHEGIGMGYGMNWRLRSTCHWMLDVGVFVVVMYTVYLLFVLVYVVV